MDHCIIVMRFGANRTSATAAGPPAAATWRFRASVCVMPASGHFTQVSEKTQSRWRRHFPVMLILFYRGASRRSADDQTGKRARCGESWEGAEGGARGGAPAHHNVMSIAPSTSRAARCARRAENRSQSNLAAMFAVATTTALGFIASSPAMVPTPALGRSAGLRMAQPQTEAKSA